MRATPQPRAPSTLSPTTTPPRRPVSVAITGGIGAGKSEALKAFARHGAAVVSSDDIVHALLRENDEVRAALAERFGPQVIAASGEVDRAAIADIVFNDRAALDWLEALLHPRVAQQYLAWRDALAAGPHPPALCVTEVPLLYESGGDARFDVVVVVTAPADVRGERSHVRRDDREQRLIPDEEKVKRADFAYVNDGTLEELDAFITDVVAKLSA